MTPRPVATDAFPTATSRAQAETEAVLLKHIAAPDIQQDPVLDKTSHMQFLVRNLVQGFPSRYISQDASQPWLLFWTIQSFSSLQVALDPANKQRVIDKVMKWQHPDGGFGGGPGQAAHLLPTYASVCTLAVVGRSGTGGGWDQIDRAAIYKFFMSLKQNDGSFLVAHHSEVDVRGIYCLLVVATLLDILTPELVEGTAEFIASCQTYEGGFASASHPSYSLGGELLPHGPRPPLGEAHGGYTFCALASWVLLQPYLASIANDSRPKPAINIDSLLRWLVHMQGIDIELGGFKGRTNKLVDGCYSWWCGGAFSLLEALGVGGLQNAVSEEVPIDSGTPEGVWDDVDEGLLNRHALQEYVLSAGQHPAGGLRDKPPKNADAYHTHYCLSGLSSAQHHVFPSKLRRSQVEEAWEATDSHNDAMRKRCFSEILSWTEEEGGSHIIGGQNNRVNATHPVTNLTMTHTEQFVSYFYKQKVPARILRKKPTTSPASAPGPGTKDAPAATTTS
ncbi:terpenoid cyclases/protein prenyltransferase alpha-alpha toroid [Crepidotus variabilis]|uniref:Protein farnesyltransferase subunit beta n=1 Tax=Crepidotus variabilis TaxID=179855 RepID=A0A9P6E8P5_9AGAR|nr:terpenoid cyclases/protein prenyltransferase alpha-alpha toroid [Crepidotus variabilis]